ncbi:MAG: cytochrome c biogenesis CcdA family protein [Methanolobus sp.]|uniref:cytochrome c biogenesis CcdA family protein n=1 Tax=Methanolobus sp. TaxID=1874737 RepID=UPI00273096AB|nr:cytochrome c biogenesis CcdA family protein [Methanolobus sp.]MDP2217524.1 cytochrome c biogenesis CcdA family protein [Methanolobus sp.]
MFQDTFTLGPVASFLAGIVSVLSPCVLPLLPVILAYSAGKGKFRPFAIVFGLSLSFTLMGIIASAFGAVLYPHIENLRILAGLLIAIFGISMLFGADIFGIVANYTGKIHVQNNSAFGGLLLGVSLGVIWIPCVGPILGAILAAVALEGNMTYGASMLFIYSIGFAVPMLIIAYSANISSARLSRIARYDAIIKKVAGVLLILAGSWMVYTNAAM